MKDVEITKETRKAIEELLGSQAVTKLGARAKALPLGEFVDKGGNK